MTTTHKSTDSNMTEDLPKYPAPVMPPPPYFQTHFINPSSFKAAINTKLDTPAISLYRLCIRMLQLAFALASGISYALEMQNKAIPSKTNFIFAEVVFSLTLIVLVLDSITIRYYRVSWLFEWILTVLWFTCFGVFYSAFLGGNIDGDLQQANLARMRRAVWMNLINALLWTSSAIFSSAMCCAGTRATIKNKLSRREQKKETQQGASKIGEMETGYIGEAAR